MSLLPGLQICHEFERFSVYLPSVKVGNFFGGLPLQSQKSLLKDDTPHIVVGTPGRLKQVCFQPPLARNLTLCNIVEGS